MKRYKKTVTLSLILLVLVFLFSVSLAQEKNSYRAGGDNNQDLSFYQPAADTETYSNVKGKSVKNVILLIGDGMSFNQFSIARIKGAGLDGKLYMEKLPVTGIMRTHSANNIVTDSAASGTALACGIKTNNKMLGMAPDETKYKTILEAAGENKMATGLVVTSRITHATPACFAAHVRHRDMERRIAPQLIENKKVNVLFGGGRDYFLPREVPGGRRKDERNLIEEAKSQGYSYIENKEQLRNAKGPYVLGLFQIGSLTTKEPEPSLAELTKKAVEILDVKEQKRKTFLENMINGILNLLFFGTSDEGPGFFIMVEGSQIDWACHDYDADRVIRLTLLFDLAVKEAMEFAIKDKHTLVIVTADHETSGLTITEAEDGMDLELLWAVDKEHKRGTSGHTGQPVAVFAFGPKAEIFSGVYDNTDIPKKIAEVLKIKQFPAKLE